jgi:hypothetical protein
LDLDSLNLNMHKSLELVKSFALPRHQMNAACHRAVLQERFATWQGWTLTTAADKVL